MDDPQAVREHGTLTSPRPRTWTWSLVTAVVAAALVAAIVGSLESGKPAQTGEHPTGTASVTGEAAVTPMDHSVVRLIDASAEPDMRGASIATYGP